MLSERTMKKGWLRLLGAGAVLAILPLSANADTLATFDWIPFQNGGSGTGSGDFQLTLPGSVGGPGFDVHFASVTAAQNALTGFSYTFSNGDQLSLANLRAIGDAGARWLPECRRGCGAGIGRAPNCGPGGQVRRPPGAAPASETLVVETGQRQPPHLPPATRRCGLVAPARLDLAASGAHSYARSSGAPWRAVERSGNHNFTPSPRVNNLHSFDI